MTDTQEVSHAERNRRCNKAQIAELFSVAASTVDAWIRRGCPHVQRGGLSKPWVFDAQKVMEWRFAHDHAAAPIEPDRMTPPDRRAWYYSEEIRRKLVTMQRELIPAEDLENCLKVMQVMVSECLLGIPGKLADVGLHHSGVLAAEEAIQSELASFTDRLGDIAKPKGG